MNLKDLTNLQFIKSLFSITNQKVSEKFSEEDLRKNLGLYVSKTGFYGTIDLSSKEIYPLDLNVTNFVSGTDVTLLIEGNINLSSTPVNTGGGKVTYYGNGILNVRGTKVYDGKQNSLANTTDAILGFQNDVKIGAYLKQLVTLPAGYEFLHGSCIVGPYVFFGCRINSTTAPTRIIRCRLDDITSQTLLILPDNTYNAAEQLTYVPEKGKIYIAHHISAGNVLNVTELDPYTMGFKKVIQEDIGYRNYYPTTCTDGTYLYVISGQQTVGTTMKIRKYDLNAYILVSELDTGVVAGGHSAKFDGANSIFITTSYRTVAVQQYVIRVDTNTFTVVDQGAIAGESYTDDLVYLKGKLFLGMEYIFNTPAALTIAMIDRYNLSSVQYLTFPTLVGSTYGVFTDGKYVYFLVATTPGHIVRLDPETMITNIYDTPAGEDIPNELLYDGKNYYLAYWLSPAKIARYDAFNFQSSGMMKAGTPYVYKNFTLDV